jgi:hypothetical protein
MELQWAVALLEQELHKNNQKVLTILKKKIKMLKFVLMLKKLQLNRK